MNGDSDGESMINITEIKEAIAPPGIIFIEEPSSNPKDKRVSKSDRWIHENIIALFAE